MKTGHTKERERLLHEEAQFADEEYRPFYNDLAINPAMFAKYSHPSDLSDWRQCGARLLGNVRGKRLLDLGCGMGEEAVYFAKLGAMVTAIDVSPVGIEITRRRAEFNGMSVDALCAACPTEFCAGSFELIHGHGVVHHIGAKNTMVEVHRLLSPGGIGVFLEPMGNSRWVETVKCWLHYRLQKRLKLVRVNENEQTLRWQEICECVRVFSHWELRPYHISYRVRKLLPRFLWLGMRHCDHIALRCLPVLRHYAGAVVILVRK